MSPMMKSVGPLSYQGVTASGSIAPEDIPPIHLKVVEREARDAGSTIGLISTSSCVDPAWKEMLEGGCHITLAEGCDCVVPVRVDSSIPEGCIALGAVQSKNLYVGYGETYSFAAFAPPATEPFELADMDAEVKLVPADSEEDFADVVDEADEVAVKLDARTIEGLLMKQCVGQVLAVGQQLVLQATKDHNVVVRVAVTNTLDWEAREEAVAYHCFRGLLSPETQIYLSAPPPPPLVSSKPRVALLNDSASDCLADARPDAMSRALGAKHVELLDARTRPQNGRSVANIDVYTRDEEVFPVQRKLLRPCIALTASVRDTSIKEVSIDVDCLIFDRVLMFLEAQHLGKEPPNFAMHLMDDLIAASEALGLGSLEKFCAEKCGTLASRLRTYTFEEIRALNAAGMCIIIVNGMLLDVTKWLDEHPGGSTIIPAQALNIECSRFYEVYHVSRESFLYIKEFYIGELAYGELELVPCDEPASEDFMQQLREYTGWRMKVEEPKVAKHL